MQTKTYFHYKCHEGPFQNIPFFFFLFFFLSGASPEGDAGDASPFCAFFMYLGPSVEKVVSSAATSTPWAISDTGGRSLLISLAFSASKWEYAEISCANTTGSLGVRLQ